MVLAFYEKISVLTFDIIPKCQKYHVGILLKNIVCNYGKLAVNRHVRPFTVPDRSPFLSVPESFRSFYERFRSFVNFLRRSTGIRIININDKKRSVTVNGQERSSRNKVTFLNE